MSPAAALANYAITSNTATFTITAKTATVTPAAASKSYGAVDPALMGTLSGFAVADGVTAAYSRVTGETVAGGPYTISATLSPAAVLTNYTITHDTASFTITPATASVTPAAASKTYGAVDPMFTGTLSGFLPADGVTATYSRAAGESVAGGPYAITATLSPAAALANYTITHNTATFTIAPATASVTPAAASKTYGAVDPVLMGTLSGFAAADGVTATYSRATGETVAGGPYAITATLGPAVMLANYSITVNTASFTIYTAQLTVKADDRARAYGAANPAFTASYSGFMNGETLATSGVTGAPSLTTAATLTSAVGEYPIVTAQGTLTAANYTLAFLNGTLNIVLRATDDSYASEANVPLTVMAPGVLANDDREALTAVPAVGGTRGIVLRWDGRVVAASYNVKRSTTSGGPYTTIATDVNSAGYTDVNVTNATVYYYVVSALNVFGECKLRRGQRHASHARRRTRPRDAEPERGRQLHLRAERTLRRDGCVPVSGEGRGRCALEHRDGDDHRHGTDTDHHVGQPGCDHVRHATRCSAAERHGHRVGFPGAWNLHLHDGR